MAAAIASGLIRKKREAREQHVDRPPPNRRRKSPSKNKGLCNGNLVDIFSKVRIFGLKKRRLRRQGVRSCVSRVCEVSFVTYVANALCCNVNLFIHIIHLGNPSLGSRQTINIGLI